MQASCIWTPMTVGTRGDLAQVSEDSGQHSQLQRLLQHLGDCLATGTLLSLRKNPEHGVHETYQSLHTVIHAKQSDNVGHSEVWGVSTARCFSAGSS